MDRENLRVSPSGIEMRLIHISGRHGLLYAAVSHPPGATAFVIVCSSILGEFVANYHRERTLERALTEAGIGVLRFHYAGEGNSQGERDMLTVETLVDDAHVVADYASSLAYAALGFVGTRMGAVVAAAVVSTMPGTVPLAMWEPLEDPMKLITDGRRARRMSQLAQDTNAVSPNWTDELEHAGRLDLLGYDIHRPLVESLKEVDLMSALGSTARAIYIARFREASLSGDLLVEELGRRGFYVESGNYRLDEAWWFDRETEGPVGAVVADTADWLGRNL